MQDRVSLYPGRLKLVPVPGQENTYDMVRADSPTQEGTPLNKDSLLKDATAALLGGGKTMVPDEAFVILKNLSDELKNSAVQLTSGTYVGTGTYGISNKNSLTFSFVPKLFVVMSDSGYYSPSILYCGQPGKIGTYGAGVAFVLSGNTISWYSSTNGGVSAQANESGVTYYYIAIGFLEGA